MRSDIKGMIEEVDYLLRRLSEEVGRVRKFLYNYYSSLPKTPGSATSFLGIFLIVFRNIIFDCKDVNYTEEVKLM